MANGKKYYWMKLKESFLKSDTVDFFMSLPDGAHYVILYQMLCLLTINTGGKLVRQIGEMVIKYDVGKIKRECKWFSEKTIRTALDYYKSFGLMYETSDGILVLTDYSNLVGSETDYSEQKRNQRNKVDKPVDKIVDNVHPSVHINNGDEVDKSVDNVHTENRKKILDNRYSFNQSIAREENELFEAEKKASQRVLWDNKLGKGVVFLSDDQAADLLEKLSLDEFNYYVGVVADCELSGKRFKNKTHYQAILDMARKDRKVK